ncbi:MAG: hypothetical protein ABSG99_04725 [Sedimentisphaerales bacterium]
MVYLYSPQLLSTQAELLQAVKASPGDGQRHIRANTTVECCHAGGGEGEASAAWFAEGADRGN